MSSPAVLNPYLPCKLLTARCEEAIPASPPTQDTSRERGHWVEPLRLPPAPSLRNEVVSALFLLEELQTFGPEGSLLLALRLASQISSKASLQHLPGSRNDPTDTESPHSPAPAWGPGVQTEPDLQGVLGRLGGGDYRISFPFFFVFVVVVLVCSRQGLVM